jgi:hypothetical protein
MKILYIPLDFLEWKNARHLTYFFSLGFEEAFRANGIDFTTIPTICKDSAGTRDANRMDAWLVMAKNICSGQVFDQVWVEAVHNPLDEDVLRWLESLAPIRLAMVGESLIYDREVSDANPHLANRRSMVEGRLRHFTHALIVDEADAADLTARNVIKTFWYPSAVPERFLGAGLDVEPEKRASFSGAVYGKRGSLLDDPRFKGILSNTPSQDAEFGIPEQFDSVQRKFLSCIDSGRPVGREMLEAYLRPLRAIRSESFGMWIRHLSKAGAVVNLPSYYQGYAGRVAEGVAAGRAVISWDVMDRPRNRALFVEGEEILLFHEDDRDGLHSHIQNVMGDPLYAQAIAGRALRRMWRFHTLEKRVGFILDWMETGVEPDFSERRIAVSIPADLAAFDDCLAGREMGDAGRLMGLAKEHMAAGRFNHALKSFLEVLKLGRNDTETWVACANAALKSGNPAIARIALDGVRKLDPNHAELRALTDALME